jgi:hypothetical protein
MGLSRLLLGVLARVCLANQHSAMLTATSELSALTCNRALWPRLVPGVCFKLGMPLRCSSYGESMGRMRGRTGEEGRRGVKIREMEDKSQCGGFANSVVNGSIDLPLTHRDILACHHFQKNSTSYKS